MRIFSKKAIVLSLLLISCSFQLFSFSHAIPVQASESLISSQEGFSSGEIAGAFNESGKPDDIRKVVASVIKVALLVLGLIFVTLLVLAGYKYMTANGSEDQTKTAMKQITQAVIGLIIVLAAWGITTFVVKQAGKATGNQVENGAI